MSSKSRFALRKSIDARASERALACRETGAEMRVDATAYAIALRLKGKKTLPAVAREVGVPEAAAAAAVRLLLYADFATPKGAPPAPVRALEASARVDPGAFRASAPLVTAPETRFACQSCGACCRSFGLGPVFPTEADRIRSLPLAEAFPELAGSDPFRPGPAVDGQATLLLRPKSAEDSACVFLQADNLCGLHARFGADSKPLACRVFPFAVSWTARGLEVYDRGDCASYDESAFAGPPLRDELEQDPALAARLRALPGRIATSPVPLGKGVAISFARYLPFEALALRLVREIPGTAREALRAVKRAAATVTRSVRAAALDLDPDAVLAALYDSPSARYAGATADPPWSDLGAAVRPVRSTLGQVAERLEAGAEERVEGAETFYAAAVPGLLGLLHVDPPAAAVDAALRSPDVDRYLRTLLLQLITGKGLLRVARLPSLGLGWLAVVVDLLLAGAWKRARETGSTAIAPQHLATHQSAILRALRDRAFTAGLAADASSLQQVAQAL